MAILVVILVLIHNTQGRRWDDADLVGCFRGQLGGAEAARWPRVDDHIHHYGVHGNAEDVHDIDEDVHDNAEDVHDNDEDVQCS